MHATEFVSAALYASYRRLSERPLREPTAATPDVPTPSFASFYFDLPLSILLLPSSPQTNKQSNRQTETYTCRCCLFTLLVFACVCAVSYGVLLTLYLAFFCSLSADIFFLSLSVSVLLLLVLFLWFLFSSDTHSHTHSPTHPPA
jgi:hypothetical protein